MIFVKTPLLFKLLTFRLFSRDYNEQKVFNLLSDFANAISNEPVKWITGESA